MLTDQTQMRGKICLVTGATSGIGKETALGLARMGATVLLVARDDARGAAAVADIRQRAPQGSVELLLADLSSLSDVRQLATHVLARESRLDVLINNAGVALARRRVTEDGLEATFATNYLAPFLLTHLLSARLRESSPARIVNVASDTHRRVKTIPWDDLQSEREYAMQSAYNRTKLFNVLFTYALAKRLTGTGVTANCLHPGWPLKTDLGREIRGAFALFIKASSLFAASAAQGAETALYLASAPTVERVNGRYFAACKPVDSSTLSHDEAAAERLWTLSECLCGLEPARAQSA